MAPDLISLNPSGRAFKLSTKAGHVQKNPVSDGSRTLSVGPSELAMRSPGTKDSLLAGDATACSALRTSPPSASRGPAAADDASKLPCLGHPQRKNDAQVRSAAERKSPTDADYLCDGWSP